jgi:hypothetical protein
MEATGIKEIQVSFAGRGRFDSRFTHADALG